MRQYAETILNAISAHVAVINAKGLIIETNLALMDKEVLDKIQALETKLGLSLVAVDA